jgi:hypothetical protein
MVSKVAQWDYPTIFVCTRFQAAAAKEMRASLFWVITEQPVAILYRKSLPNNPEGRSSQYFLIISRFLKHYFGTRSVITQNVRFTVITKY